MTKSARPELRTARLLLRQWRPDDLPLFAALNADPRVMEFFPAPKTASESNAQAAWIEKGIEANGYGLWAVEVPGAAPFIGFVGLSPVGFRGHFTPCVEVGWRLAFDHWGRGYATEGARAALAHGFGRLALPEIVSFTAAGNARSRAVMAKLGMVRDPRDDFDHPAIAEGNPLRRHVLYRIGRPIDQQ